MCRPLRVLLAEDSGADADQVLAALRHGGFDPVVVRSPAPAAGPWDVVLSAPSVSPDPTREATFRAFFDSSAIGMVEADRRGRLLRTNAAFAQLVGYSAAELAEMTPPDLSFPADRDAFARQYGDLRAGRTDSYTAERTYRRKDGSAVAVVASVAVVRDAAGRPQRIAAVVLDVSERRRAEDAARRTEHRFRAVVEDLTEVVSRVAPDGTFLFVNDVYARVFGRPAAELIGTRWQPVAHPDDLPEVSARLREIGPACPIVRVENRVFDGAGAVRWMEFVNRGFFDPNGELVEILSVGRDVTDRKRAEEALRVRDRAIQAVTQGILITDATRPDQPIAFASPGFERMTGYAAAEVAGKNCRFLQGPDTDPAAMARLKAAIAAGEPATVEMLNYRQDGSPFWNELSISPVRDAAGRLTNFVGVQTDVTERRRLEEQYRQSQKMEAVGRLAGGIAHDFNNLLTVINGYSDLLLEDLPPANPARELVAEIHKAARSAGLTRQLLAFSRKQVLTPRVIELNAVVADTERMLRRVIGEDVRLATALDAAAGAVLADPGQLELLLLNLAVNARDAMPTGGRLTISTRAAVLSPADVRTRPEVNPGPYALLTVTDTGVGMTPAVRDRVFEPFFTTKGPGVGTGLGLATVYGIVKQAGGHIEVESEPGRGTAFHIHLPRAEPAAGNAASRPAAVPPPRGAETVLVVEDEDGVRALTRHVLTANGYTVREAADGDAALAAAARPGPLHLLVVDVVMPGMGGREVADRVAAQHPGLRVLFVSGYTDDALVRHGVRRGEFNFLQKPYSPQALAVKVREVLDGPPRGGK